MTSFKGTESHTPSLPPPPNEGKTEEPQEEKKPLEPRLKASKKHWAKAMQLANMLQYCRPHQSKTEGRFIQDFLKPIGVLYDKKGNMYKQIGDAPILWSSHIDTVHNKKGFQKIVYWVDSVSGDTFFRVADDCNSSCLGADDTAGVWLMLEMIYREVPGLYIFHRGEECGGIGSKWIAANNKDALKDIKYAVAFDRRETGSIITYQGGTRCCSDDFAKSLADQLGMNHTCDETGSFTDTASYVDHIAECTNISAGYYNAHCTNEKLNVDYLFRLRDAICKIDVSKLAEKRKPGENTRRWGGSNYRSDLWDDSYDYYGYGKDRVKPKGALDYNKLKKLFPGNGCQWIDHYYWDRTVGFYMPCKGRYDKNKDKKDLGVTKLSSSASNYNDTVRLVRLNPEIIADLLEGQGYGSLEIKEHIEKCGGNLLS